jgi:hypothetical protein
LATFVADHQHRIADLKFGVHDAAAGAGHAHFLLGAKGVRIELERAGGIANDKIGRYRVVTLGNRLYRCGHFFLLNLRTRYHNARHRSVKIL